MRQTQKGSRLDRIAEKLSALGPEAEYVVEDMLNEVLRATAKHPKWPHDPVHASAILNEEAGELTQAALDFHYGNKSGASQNLINAGLDSMREEAVQTGAMAVRFLLNMGSYAGKDRAYAYGGRLVIEKTPATGPTESLFTIGARFVPFAGPFVSRELRHTAYSQIVAERAKQLARGFDDAHDNEHKKGELARMAAFFAVPGNIEIADGVTASPEAFLPEHLRGDDALNRSTIPFFGIEPRIRDLVKAGGCIVAEIERLQRSAGVNPEELED